MRAAIGPAAALWAALVCAWLAAWAALQRDDQWRRARRLLSGSPAGHDTRRGAEHEAEPGSEDVPREPTRTAAGPGPAGHLWTWRSLGAERASVWGRWRPWRTDRSLGGRLCGRSAKLAAACLAGGALLAALTRSVLPLVAGAAAVPLVRRALRGRAERAAAERVSAAVSALCGTVAGDLRAGLPPHAALTDAVESAGWSRTPELAEAARLLLSAARFGGDVPQALRAASRCRAGAHGLAAAAACWQVAVDGGAGLAAALDRVAAALRAEADQRDDLRAQLAGPRSTAVLLALLPVFGLVLGTGLGADPAEVLLHTPVGLCCLVAGALLEWGGLAWTARIIHAAEGGPGDPRPRRPLRGVEGGRKALPSGAPDGRSR